MATSTKPSGAHTAAAALLSSSKESFARALIVANGGRPVHVTSRPAADELFESMRPDPLELDDSDLELLHELAPGGLL